MNFLVDYPTAQTDGALPSRVETKPHATRFDSDREQG